jgi:tetratricopeptide (TPR) repeat protein
MRRLLLGLIVTLSLVSLAFAAPVGTGSGGSVPPGAWALDQAFRFASAITADPKDMAKAQQSVVEAWLQIDELDHAARAAAEVDGWRKGVCQAKVAQAMAAAGRAEEARALLGKAQSTRRLAQGWRRTRIAAHVAEARAALGATDQAAALAGQIVRADSMYGGRSAATVARARAAEGDVDGAFEILDGVPDDKKDINVTWWRAVGYLELADMGTLSRDARLRALASATEAARAVAGWKRADVYQKIARAYAELGETAKARAAMEAGDEVVARQPDTLPIKAVLMAEHAKAWFDVGDEDAARQVLSRAEPVALEGMKTERPAIYGALAGAWLRLGDDEQSARLLDKAFDRAEELAARGPRGPRGERGSPPASRGAPQGTESAVVACAPTARAPGSGGLCARPAGESCKY